MVHPSTHLAYCWHLTHILEDHELKLSDSTSGKGPRDDRFSFHGSFSKGKRRQKFRKQGGPSREELRRSHILSILRDIPPLTTPHQESPLRPESSLPASSSNPLPNSHKPRNNDSGGHSNPSSYPNGAMEVLSEVVYPSDGVENTYDSKTLNKHPECSTEVIQNGGRDRESTIDALSNPRFCHNSFIEHVNMQENGDAAVAELSSNSGSFSSHSLQAQNGDLESLSESSAGPSLCARTNELPEDVLWPFLAVSDLGEHQNLSIDWDAMPASADPLRGLGYKPPLSRSGFSRNEPHARDLNQKSSRRTGRNGHDLDDGDEGEGGLVRGVRKRFQVWSIATSLKSFNLPAGSMIVDFGCGSGALSLPLAYLFTEFTFICVDYKNESIRLLDQHAQAAKLKNIVTWQGRIEDYLEPFHACVALHVCGNATDLALFQALKCRAAYIVSPCCVGKLQFAVLNYTSLHSQQDIVHNELFESNLELEEEGYMFIDLLNQGTLRVGEEKAENGSATVKALDSAQPSKRNELHSSLSILDKFTGKGKEVGASSAGSVKEVYHHTENIKGTGHSRSELCKCFKCSQSRDVTPNYKSKNCSEVRLTYPRSKWLRSVITPSDFVLLARTADWSSYDYESRVSRLHSLCKILVELDRNQASQELGYHTQLLSLSDHKAGAVGVGHVLVGKPSNK